MGVSWTLALDGLGVAYAVAAIGVFLYGFRLYDEPFWRGYIDMLSLKVLQQKISKNVRD